jgi:hypothetical protein
VVGLSGSVVVQRGDDDVGHLQRLFGRHPHWAATAPKTGSVGRRPRGDLGDRARRRVEDWYFRYSAIYKGSILNILTEDACKVRFSKMLLI